MTEALQRNLFDEIMVQDIEPRLGIKNPHLFMITLQRRERWPD